MKKTIKSKNAITLIALVLTIIILIILAGISISILTGQDGLITKAKQGAQNYQNAAVEEQDMLNTIGIYTDLKGDTNGHGTNIKTKEGEIIIPGKEDIVIPAGTYLSGNIIIKGNTNLEPENIKEGVEIFNVEGTAQTETTHTEIYTIPSNEPDIENIDLGINHNYRYINATNIFNNGKAEGDIKHTVGIERFGSYDAGVYIYVDGVKKWTNRGNGSYTV